MTRSPEERIAVLETEQAGMKEWLRSIDEKQDRLIEAANMGRGAWWAILKLGGLLLLASGGIAWIYEHWPRK